MTMFATEAPAAPGALLTLPADQLTPDNYRAEDTERVARLAVKIGDDGAVHNPVLVRWDESRGWIIVDGHHRYGACKLLGWDVPCRVVDAEDRRTALVLSMGANLSAQASKATEDAAGFAELVDLGMSAEEIARRTVVRADVVARRLEIMSLDPACRYIADKYGPTWAGPLVSLPHSVQRDLVRLLESEGFNRVQWSEAIARFKAKAEELDASQAAMFGGDFGLAVEEWSTADAAYLSDLKADPVEETAPPVIVRESVLGMAELAEYIGAKRPTVYKWQQRGQLPPADLTVSGQPAWYSSTIDAWQSEKLS
jgi:ParB-like chromosome segregation protein Spo0J/predicted DNA-binding transcriptional regulator AlpA